MEVELEKIKCPEELYPRDSFDNETVNNYRMNIDALPPIVLSKDFILVDGLHRLMAYRIEQRERINVEEPLLDISGDDIYREAIKRNSFHGKQLTMSEKKTAADRLHTNGNDKELSELLGISERTIDSWLSKVKANERKARNQEIIDLYLQCYEPTDISKNVGISERQIERIIKERQESIIAEMSKPDSLQLYNVWNFPQPDKHYGLSYPGRIPGQIIENLLYYYTEPFDKIIDPMAGGGTTLDVCKTMYRRSLAYDIKPVREDIISHDIKTGFPEKAKQSDLIFLDPPYWRLKRKEYSDDSISANTLDGWLEFMSSLITSCKTSLRPGKYLALIIEAFDNERETGEFLDLPFMCSNIAINEGFKEVQRIMTPMPTQIKNHHDVNYSKDNRILLDLNRDLIIFKKK